MLDRKNVLFVILLYSHHIFSWSCTTTDDTLHERKKALKVRRVEHFSYLGCDFIFNNLSHRTVPDRGHIECGQAHHVNLERGGRRSVPSGDWSHYQLNHFVGAGPHAAQTNKPSRPLPFPVLC